VQATSAAGCAGCGARLPAGALACGACAKLVHSDELERLASEAREAESKGDASSALAAWRGALELLPPATRQRAAVESRIVELSSKVGKSSPPSKVPAWLAGLGAAGLALWKLKFVLGFLATKGKLLLAGLTKGKTLLSMLVSLGVYWQMWGWPFAAGLIASLYVHEMGHVAALRRFGVRASAPMFVPGLGAYVRLEQKLATPREEARVGIAGPWWGLGAALAAFGVHVATGSAMFAAIARAGAWLNLFNLLPLGPLDGGRALSSLDRRQRWACVLAIAVAWFATHEALLVLLLGAAAYRAWKSDREVEPDGAGLAHYVVVLAGHSALLLLDVPGA
jgi:Zn-dependent protease